MLLWPGLCFFLSALDAEFYGLDCLFSVSAIFNLLVMLCVLRAAGLSALHGLRVTFDEHTAALSAIGV
jgi:hypothetical protein